MDHTCFPFFNEDSWVTSSFPHMCPAAVLGGPTQTLASSSEGRSPCFSQCFYFLHRVRFGGLPERGLLGTGLGQADTSDSSDLNESRMVRGGCKRVSPWIYGVGTTSQRGSKRLKGPDPTHVPPSRGQSNSNIDLATGGVTDIPLLPCPAGNSVGR